MTIWATVLFADSTYETSVEKRSSLDAEEEEEEAMRDCTVIDIFVSELSDFVKASRNDSFLASVTDMPVKDWC